MNILALDPAARTGFAHSNGHSGAWVLSATRRLTDLHNRIMAVKREWGLDKLAFEDASFGSHNPHVQAMHNELRGVIKMVAEQLRIPAVGYNPMTIKKFATNNGRAKKHDMVRACTLLLGREPTTDDEADALFILEMAKQGLVIGSTAKKRPPRVRRRSGTFFDVWAKRH